MTEKFKIINNAGDYHLMNGDEELCYDLCSPIMMPDNWNKVVDKLNQVAEENEQLKETIKELELENAKHIGDGEWDIRDITYGHGKFRLEEWGERYHQFYNGNKQLEDEEVVSLLFENEKLKKKILEEIDLEVAYVNETYSDYRMSKEQHNGAIISLRQLREKFE